MSTTALAERGNVRVHGAEARSFLDGLVTCDLDRVGPGRPRFGALLSPQGKILFDFHLWQTGDDEFHLDVQRPLAPDLVKRLGLYRLRAKVGIEDASNALAVVAGWEGAPPPAGAAGDPRLAALGWRLLVPRAEAGQAGGNEEGYQAKRIRLGVPESGRDFALGETFPHEALMDQLGGVDFDKGCYVGQEVVSRMQHRGTARSRIVPIVHHDGAAALPGAEVTAAGRVIGRMGSATGERGLALVRLDRVGEALAGGEPILAGGHPVRIELPGWVTFTLPAPGA